MKSNRIKKITYSLLLVLAGFLLGSLTMIRLFAIDVDMLAIPYINKGVILEKDIAIAQDDIVLEIPKGAQMLWTRRLPGSNEYCILINSRWDKEENILGTSSRPNYCEVVDDDKRIR
jgi:hypothetical protein